MSGQPAAAPAKTDFVRAARGYIPPIATPMRAHLSPVVVWMGIASFLQLEFPEIAIGRFGRRGLLP
jgi:hypothetical protein